MTVLLTVLYSELLKFICIFINHELHELHEFRFFILSNFSNLKNASIFIREI